MTGTTIETEEFKMTEIGALPFEWEVAKLGNLVKSTKGKKPHNMAKVTPSNSLPYLTAVYFRTGHATHFVSLNVNVSLVLVENNDVVFIWDGSNAGDVFTGLKGVLASTMVKITPEDSNTLDKKYLFYFLKNRFDLFNSTTTGSTIPHVNKKVFQDLSVPVPPLPEQKKIAYVLSTVQAAIEKTEAVITASRELKTSLMKHLFTFGPVSIDEAENVPPKETEIGMVPEAWSVKTLAESVESIEYGYSISIPSEENMYGVPIISTADITKDGSILYNQVRRINPPKRLTERLLLRDGDLLFNWRNAPALVGKTAIYEEQSQKHIYASFIMRIRTGSNLSNSFLCYLLNYYRQIGVFLKLARRAVNQANYNKNEISVLKVPLPPLAVQQKTADILSGVDRRMEVEENKKKALEELFKTLLSNLMTGKIRVDGLEVPV